MAAPLVRSARNQILFREVNGRIHDLLKSESEGPLEFLCECTDQDCTGTIMLEREEYERIRSGPTHFVVVPGHELLEAERIVHQTDRFVTVEKIVAVIAVNLIRAPRRTGGSSDDNETREPG